MTSPLVLKIHLRIGRGPIQPNLEFSPGSLTVFVGPNNSGKSLVLREIDALIRNGSRHDKHSIISSLRFRQPDGIEQEIERLRLPSTVDQPVREGYIRIGTHKQSHELLETDYRNALSNPESNTSYFCTSYLQYRMLFLDGKTRIDLVKEQPAGDLQQLSQNTLQTLFSDNSKRERVRDVLYDAFHEQFVIDPTKMGTLRVRMSTTPPPNEETERGIHQASVSFHARAVPIEEKSDGVKAFTGIMMAIMGGDPILILIDEPEAFLHPSLSFKLGKQIALQTSGTSKNVFASTHSESFLRGVIQSGAPVNIVRLTYRQSVATARLLQHRDLVKLMRNPILRSARPIQGLFSEFVVVCEGDTDRAFYEEINERLSLYSDCRAIPNCLFINAHNKSTIPTILKPLREMGIPAAGVVDLDVLKKKDDWAKFLNASGVPAIQHQGFGNQRHQVVEQLVHADENWKKNGGIGVLEGDNLDGAKNLLQAIAAYGVFIVPGGEVESWLKILGVRGKSAMWLERVFEKMGEGPQDERYLVPTEGDVWAFVGQIKEWMSAPDIKGIPD